MAKPLDPISRKSIVLHVRVHPDVAASIQRIATKQRIDPSDVMRHAFDDHIAKCKSRRE